MKNLLFIGAILVVLYFLMRQKNAPAVAVVEPRIPKYVATGYQGTIDIVSVAASQPIIPGNNFLNLSETAD